MLAVILNELRREGEQDDASNQLLQCSPGRGEEAAIFYSTSVTGALTTSSILLSLMRLCLAHTKQRSKNCSEPDVDSGNGFDTQCSSLSHEDLEHQRLSLTGWEAASSVLSKGPN